MVEVRRVDFILNIRYRRFGCWFGVFWWFVTQWSSIGGFGNGIIRRIIRIGGGILVWFYYFLYMMKIKWKMINFSVSICSGDICFQTKRNLLFWRWTVSYWSYQNTSISYTDRRTFNKQFYCFVFIFYFPFLLVFDLLLPHSIIPNLSFIFLLSFILIKKLI